MPAQWRSTPNGAILSGMKLLCTLALLLTLAGCSSSGNSESSGPHGAGFVSKITQNATVAAHNATALLKEIFAAVDADDDSSLYQIATDSKDLHDHLFDWRDDVIEASSISDDDQQAFVDAENELKNAAGSVNSWTDDPSPTKTDAWETQMAHAVAHWNAAVTVIWSKADAGAPPTITVPS